VGFVGWHFGFSSASKRDYAGEDNLVYGSIGEAIYDGASVELFYVEASIEGGE
jgi:hypothetical protein